MLNARFGALLEAALEREAEVCIRLFDGDDARTAVGAFVERHGGAAQAWPAGYQPATGWPARRPAPRQSTTAVASISTSRFWPMRSARTHARTGRGSSNQRR